MQVLLLRDVAQLGHAGEVKKVTDGYARNFLFPRALAVPATPGAVKQMEQSAQAHARKQAKVLSQAQALAQALDGTTLTFHARAGESDRLYGSITNAHIADALKERTGHEVDKRKIELEEPLKELGTHAVTIHLAAEAEAKITVIVQREE